MPFYLNSTSPTHNIVTSFSSSPRYDFGVFARGYHTSAQYLAERFITRRRRKDSEGYPIVFLYRHSLELYLKNVIYWSARLCHFKEIQLIDERLYNTHDLFHLSRSASGLLLKLFPNNQGLPEFIDSLSSITSEFNSIDHSSESYRYPINRNGEHSTRPHQVVNIRSMFMSLEPLLKSFEALNFGLHYETEMAQEAYEALTRFSKGF